MISFYYRMRPAEGWITVFLLIMAMLSIIWSVVAADWIQPLPDLPLIAILAVFVAMLLAKLRVPSVMLHPLGLVLGIVGVVWQICSVMPQTTWRERVVEFAVRIYAGFSTVANGGISNDPILFIFFLTGTTWLIAYTSAWFVFRAHRVFLALIPGGIGILINLSYAPPNLAPFFGLFLLSAMLLVVRINMFKQEQEWRYSQVNFSPESRRPLYRDAIVFSTFVLLFAWLVPTSTAAPMVVDTWDKVTGPWQDAQSEFNRVFGTINVKSDGPSASFGRSMTLKGAISLNTRVIMTVRSPEPHYWRAVTYDEYTGHGWLTADAVSQNIEQVFGAASSKDYLARETITQTFRLNDVNTNAYFTGGQPVRVSKPAVVETESQSSVTVSVRDLLRGAPQRGDMGVPMETIAGVLRSNRRLLNRPDDAIKAMNDSLPGDVRVGKVTSGGGATTLSDIELIKVNEFPVDVIALRNQVPLRRGDIYSVMTSVSKANAAQLREAGDNYPSWVRGRFLQLPTTLPARVGELAKQVTAGAPKPYDKAIAIEGYLRGLTYNEQIKAPPPQEDAVDYFLFSAPEGYCDYFASAMSVMLRTVGIPARVTAGFVAGDYDSSRDAFVVRGVHAHTWVEAYFPQYGWIELEPTPIRDRLTRPEGLPDEPLPAYQFPPSSGIPFEDLGADMFPPHTPTDMIDTKITAPSSSEISVSAILMFAAMAVTALLLWLFWRRGLATLAPVPQLYERMCRFAALSSRGPRPNHTPEEFGRRLAQRLPESSASIQSIVTAYVGLRFGRKEPSDEDRRSLNQTWLKLRPKLLWTLRWRKNPPSG